MGAGGGFSGGPTSLLREVDPEHIQYDCTDPPHCADDYSLLVDKMTDGSRTGRDWLFEEGLKAAVVFAELDNVPEGGVQQIRMVFEDGYVGVFEALLHIPSGQPPWKGAVAAPGRGLKAADYPARMAIAEAGTMLLVLEPRGADGGPTEARLGVQLAEVDLTLADLRDYEIAVLQRYLDGRGDLVPSSVEVLPAGVPSDPEEG